MQHWTYDEKELREDVRLNLPADWACRVFKVTSGDSGKSYWVQVMWNHAGPLEPGTLLRLQRAQKVIILCDCPEGEFHQPLTVLGFQDFVCKHGKNLLQFLEEKGK
jgi:hypothetical protein